MVVGDGDADDDDGNNAGFRVECLQTLKQLARKTTNNCAVSVVSTFVEEFYVRLRAGRAERLILPQGWSCEFAFDLGVMIRYIFLSVLLYGIVNFAFNVC